MLSSLRKSISHNVRKVNVRNMSTSLEGFGNHVFRGSVAAPYLKAAGLSEDTIEKAKWNKDGTSDKVASAVLEWAKDNGASVFCHWFQPLGAASVRHGLTGQVQNSMFDFDKTGQPVWELKGKDIMQGETDGSSFQNGGLRDTHCAGGYLAVDPTSPIFLRGDTIFIPAALASYYGHALDEKTPLLRSNDALSREGSRLLKLLGFEVEGLQSNIGLEQEFFLVPRDAFLKRIDLQLTGRTVMGQDAPRGQEMCDHYMGPPSLTSPALACMQEIQEQCFKMGIPLRTRHREVAPNQYEFAPTFGSATTQVDQNITVMQVIEEVASSYGLAALLEEKPFSGINGSGKHNNWSIGTTCGTNILNVGQLAKNSGNADIFPVIMSAIVKAIDTHGDLMRMSIASPGNDFRLGACEAPPAILSTYLGDDMTSFLDTYRKGGSEPYSPGVKDLDMGASSIAPVIVPAEDRNRTSPFPYGGHRFEFRAAGSAQNVSMINTVLNTITASVFKEFADAIEGGQSPRDVATVALNEHWKVIFNGNNYCIEEQEKLTKAGVWRIDSGVEAMTKISDDKNTKLFSDMKVMTKDECDARKDIMLSHYTGVVEMEALCMLDMINKHVIPSVEACSKGPLDGLQSATLTLRSAVDAIHAAGSPEEAAKLARVLRLETMEEIRAICDEAESICPDDCWTLPNYKDLLFMDKTIE